MIIVDFKFPICYRDSAAYLVCVLLLLGVLADGSVSW